MEIFYIPFLGFLGFNILGFNKGTPKERPYEEALHRHCNLDSLHSFWYQQLLQFTFIMHKLQHVPI